MRTILLVLFAVLFAGCASMKYVGPQKENEASLRLNYFGHPKGAGNLIRATDGTKALDFAGRAMDNGMSASVHTGPHGTSVSAGYGNAGTIPASGGSVYAAPGYIFVPGGYAPTGATRTLPRFGTPVVTNVPTTTPVISQPVGKCPDSGVVRTVQEQAACSEDMIEVIMDNLPKSTK